MVGSVGTAVGSPPRMGGVASTGITDSSRPSMSTRILPSSAGMGCWPSSADVVHTTGLPMASASSCHDRPCLTRATTICSVISFLFIPPACMSELRRFRRGDQAGGGPWTAVPHTPSEVAAPHVDPAQFPQMGGMPTGLPHVGDGQPATRPQYPNRFVQGLSPTSVCRNVVDGQAADDHVDALVAQRQGGHVGGVHLGAFEDVFQCRIG